MSANRIQKVDILRYDPEKNAQLLSNCIVKCASVPLRLTRDFASVSLQRVSLQVNLWGVAFGHQGAPLSLLRPSRVSVSSPGWRGAFCL